ncbi:response regulator [Marinomonas communis]|uniref:CheY-like chemotaxis protein n=1 Tax=Marinomonas communis TaxID=28254 RepID=A0A4R6X7T5_9GAMM|nr:response regulator [Marinomonas communis]MCC4274716.1 response regulator [Marinomonas communis]TDR15132.1 CheY-like chemotaxis protein [Marinomonas communis]
MNKPNFSDKKALLIEDMAEARIMQKKMLNDFGFKSIEIAMKAESAIELLRSNSYDVILSDYNLGNGKDGQQLLEEVRHSHLIPNTSTYLMVTAETSTEMVMGAIEYVPDGYITKPFSQAVLERRLLKLIKNKEQLLEVNKALDANDYEKAVSEARKVADSKPALAGRCHRIIGDALMNLEKYQEALELFKTCRKESRMPWAAFGEAKCHYYLNNIDKAESKFRQLTLDNKFFVSAYDWLAKTLVKKGELEEAQAVLVDAVGRSPKNLKRQIELGKLSLDVQDNLMAEMSFRRAVFLAKHSCFNEAEVYLQHMTAIVALAREGDIPSRQIDNFQTTLSKVHQNFFDSPKVRSEAYLLEMELYSALGDKKTMNQIEEVWNHDIESGNAEPTSDSIQKRITQLKA